MIDQELSLIVHQLPDEGLMPGHWAAESETFKYLHPLDGKEETYRFLQYGTTEAEAREKAQKQLDWFNGDRGNCIIEITNFSAEELAKVTSQ